MSVRDEVHFGTWKNVQLCDWYRDTTEAGVAQLKLELEDLWARTKGPIGLFHIVGVESAPPSSATRKSLTAVLTANAPRLHVNVTLIEGDGFRAASVRAVASGIALMQRFPFPHLIEADLDTATARVVQHLGHQAGAKGSLKTAIERLRAGSMAASDLWTP